jgi:hypothetical protein
VEGKLTRYAATFRDAALADAFRAAVEANTAKA